MRYFDARDVRVRRPVSRLAKERRQALCAALNEHQAKQIQARADLIALGIAPERAPWRRMQVSIFRGSTASSTSAAITPVQILPQTSPAPCVAGSSVTGPSSGLVSMASATLIHTDSWSAAFQSYMYFQDDPAMRALRRQPTPARPTIRPKHSLGHRRHHDHPTRDRSSHQRVDFEPGRFLLSVAAE